MADTSSRKAPAAAAAVLALGLVAVTTVVVFNSFLLSTTMWDKLDPVQILAVQNEYLAHFRKDPPPNFHLWAHFALQHGCHTNPIEYAQIYRDLAPWIAAHSIPADSLPTTSTPNTRIIHFKNGRFTSSKKPSSYSFDKILAPLAPIFNGAEFKFALNTMDEPRMVPAESFAGTYANMEDVFTNSACFREKYDTVNQKNSGVNGLGVFAGNNTLRSQHGFLLKPSTFTVENSRAPIFSQAKLDGCFSDILLPFDYHIDIASAGPVHDSVEWDDKEPVLFWRGTTTGGDFKQGAPWKQYGRVRIMDWEKQWAAKHPGHTFDASKLKLNTHFKSLNVDIGFSGIVQSDEYTKKEILQQYGLKGSVSFKQTQRFKYLLVLDGNTWPSRLQQYLQTNSVILYNGIFTDFYNWKLVPMVHYVPVKLDYSDLEEKLDWLMTNDDDARRIANNAKLLMKKWSTRSQLQCYTGLALLEYSSLYAGVDE
ncbi:capsule-associated protein CAP1 [Chytriomyces hyalinus]|nr:capsule-associated protein CAP1 [Chytriomyces hyalinus]